MDRDLIRAVVQVESNYNPLAVSPKGAMGLMQLIPGTARRFGVANVFDPVQNLDGGTRYLKYLMEMFDGDLELSLAAYNAGENAVARRRSVPPIPETRNYLRKINAIYPLRRLSRAATLPATAPGIVRTVDQNGIVRFSNTGQ
jgi:soluble lytic murein transglycosylase-like protein